MLGEADHQRTHDSGTADVKLSNVSSPRWRHAVRVIFAETRIFTETNAENHWKTPVGFSMIRTSASRAGVKEGLSSTRRSDDAVRTCRHGCTQCHCVGSQMPLRRVPNAIA